jgi:hypothetical protein
MAFLKAGLNFNMTDTIPDHWAKAIEDLKRLVDHQIATIERAKDSHVRLTADVLRLEAELEASETRARILQGRLDQAPTPLRDPPNQNPS